MTARLVLDASAAIHLVLGTEGASAVADALEAASLVLAPDLYFAETASALWKYVRAGHLATPDADSRFEESMALVDETWSAESLAREVFAEANRLNHPVYDLYYAVLARRNGASLLTFDRRLATLARGLGLVLEATDA